MHPYESLTYMYFATYATVFIIKAKMENPWYEKGMSGKW